MTAGSGRPYRQLGLHGRRQRHGDRVHLGEQRVDVVVGPNAVPAGEFLRRVRAAAPHPDEVHFRVPVEGRCMGQLRPRASAEQSDAHNRRLSTLP